MSALSDLVRTEGVGSPAPMAGRVHAAPGSIAERLQVTLDCYSHRGRHEASGWVPRGDVLPGAGDRVAVVRADDGELWVVGWQPE